MADDLPIDIDYAKFLDWLLDRRRVSKSWHASLKAARVLLRSAADSLSPETTVTPPTDYYSLATTLTALEDKSLPPPFPGARDTDMLNRYSHPTSRAWSSARSSYESGCAYLAEAAQALVRAADVEAPALRGEMARLRETLAECARKEGPTTRAAADARERFRAACADMGVSSEDGVDFEKEIRTAVDAQAPQLLADAVAAGKDPRIAAALAYYAECTAYTCGSPMSSSDGNGEDERLCLTLASVVDGKVDELIAPVAQVVEAWSGEVEEAPVEVDWGSMMTSDAGCDDDKGGGGAIDWGIEIDAAGAGVDVIDAKGGANASDGIEIEARGAGADVAYAESGADAGGGIDWGDLGGASDEAGVAAAEANCSSHTLADASVRERYINDLLELGAFLSARSAELGRSYDTQVSLVLQQSDSVPAAVRAVDQDAVSGMSDAAAAALEALNGRAARHTLGLQARSDLLARAARDLSEKRHAAARLEGGISALEARRAAAAQELRKTTPRFEKLAKETRERIAETEKGLSAMYKGRQVNILGEINVVFPVS